MSDGTRREWFEDDAFWLATYDFLFTEERMAAGEEEIEAILALIGRTPRRALDLACGPGRHAIALAQRGVAVTALDRTAPLLARARERARLAGVSVDFIQTDMRRFVNPGRYDLIVNLFSSFGYWANPAEDVEVLARMHSSLAPGGRLVLEMTGLEHVLESPRSRVTRLDDDSTLTERHTIDGDRLIREWAVCRGGQTRRLEFEHRLYSGAALSGLLRAAGFAEVRLYGSLAGDPYDDQAERLVAAARSAAQQAST